jgi:Fe2+ transport system protein FeoA
MLLNICEMKNGQTGIIKHIKGGTNIIKKLEIMGVILGSKINKKSSFFKIGPCVIKVGMTELAIGYQMASKIMVEVTLDEGSSNRQS